MDATYTSGNPHGHKEESVKTYMATVLTGTIAKLNTLAHTPASILQYRETLASSVCDKAIQNAVAHQQILEKKNGEIFCELKRLSNNNDHNKTRLKMLRNELYHVSHAMKEGNKILCRAIKESPIVADNLQKTQKDVTKLIETVSNILHELQNVETLGSELKKNIGEIISSKEKLKFLANEEHIMSSETKRMRHDLNVEREKYLKRVSGMKSEVNEKKELIIRLRKKNPSLHHEEVSANHESAVLLFRQKEASLEVSIADLTNNITDETDANKEITQHLRKKCTALDNDKMDCEQEYEKEMLRIDKEYQDLTLVRNKKMNALMALKRRREQDIAEENATREAEKKEQERLMSEKEHQERTHFASMLLQRKVKAFLKQRRSKGGGKKSKKKGKKSKKEKKKT